MEASYNDLLHFVQYFAPTWRKPQHADMAQLLAALLERPTLCLSDLARAMPSPSQPLHGRLKRLMRFLDNPRLDEAALFVRWLKLLYHFGDDVPKQNAGRPMLPVLLDTTYFEPFAALLATVPCGSRGLPVALTTYHRSQLRACFPPEKAWPNLTENPCPPRPHRGYRPIPASAVPTDFISQNKIEEHLINYVFALLSPALRGVLVADRGFARASLFCDLASQSRDFVIRMDAQTHIRLPAPLAPDRPTQGEPAKVLGLRPGQSIWCPEAWYGKGEQVPIKLLALWGVGYQEPWYLVTSLDRPDHTETLYRWRMRLECTNRDEKTGVLLREGGDKHALKSVLHVHRLMLALALGEWLCALTGLQAWRDLPAAEKEATSAKPSPNCLSVVPAIGKPKRLSAAVAGDSGSPETPLPDPLRSLAANVSGPGATTAAPLPSLFDKLPHPEGDTPSENKESSAPCPEPAGNESGADEGPSLPPAVLPHRGETPKLPSWMRPFAARGHLSYVRLGLEVLRSKGLGHIPRNLLAWLSDYLGFWTPLWRPYQIRYRRKHWWADTS